jgi:autotransporter strand-loop-strand O-heptosyltransferase
MKILTRNLPQYSGMYNGYITSIEGDVKNISNQLVGLINSDSIYAIIPDETFGLDLLSMYKIVMNENITQNKPLIKDYTYVRHYVTQPYFEVRGTTENKLKIKYYDDNNNISYQNDLSINSWVKLNKEYFIKWRTTVEEDGEIIYDETLNLEDKRVYISFGSKSLGDTLAWMPYVEEFRKKHNCILIVSTFLNYLFVDQYPNIEFVGPGDIVSNIHAQYRLGWFYNEDGSVNYNMTPNDYKTQPLQKTATDILGLEYKEIRPLLNLPNTPKKKKVGIGFHSTAQAKYWNNPEGWQKVVDYLVSLGYECMIYSKEGDGYMNNNYPKGVTIYKGGNLQEVINDLSECEFFIGLGSGLSWLAWACKLPVVLISGFSEKWAETTLDTYRVINENVCHGCFNSERLDAGDWNWCPLHKNTERMFECTKRISSDMVVKEINKIINKEVMLDKNDDHQFDWGKKSDWYVDAAVKEIFEDNTYERFFEVEEGDVVVDLGASLGPFTYKILPKNPKQCYVVEPLSYQIDVLHRNVGRENVKIIQGAITDKKKIEISWDHITESVPTFTFKEFLDENNIKHIDFLKCDCEGGEYDVFQQSNIEFLKTIPKIVTEFHMRNDDNFHKCKFRWFRDNILPQFENIQIYSVDGIDIKWDLWNEHFMEWYNEIIVYMDNRGL